jgi:hypothetical protein
MISDELRCACTLGLTRNERIVFDVIVEGSHVKSDLQLGFDRRIPERLSVVVNYSQMARMSGAYRTRLSASLELMVDRQILLAMERGYLVNEIYSEWLNETCDGPLFDQYQLDFIKRTMERKWDAVNAYLDPPPPARPSSTFKKKEIPSRLAKAVFERDAYRCQDCGGHVDLTIDHIVPESKGGPTVIDNLRACCRSCNSRKGHRLDD